MPGFLDKHYAAKTVEEVKSVYDAWAPTYETELGEENYQGAQSVATIVAEVVKERDASILDVGCGTGLVGRQLHRHGFTCLNGIDLSQGMLDEAASKGCYQQLTRVDLTAPIEIAAGSFDVVVSAGLFTQSLLGPEVLKRVCELARPGGRAVIGINVEAFDAQDYPQTLDQMIQSRDGELQMIRDMPYWPAKGITSRVVVIRI